MYVRVHMPECMYLCLLLGREMKELAIGVEGRDTYKYAYVFHYTLCFIMCRYLFLQ